MHTVQSGFGLSLFEHSASDNHRSLAYSHVPRIYAHPFATTGI